MRKAIFFVGFIFTVTVLTNCNTAGQLEVSPKNQGSIELAINETFSDGIFNFALQIDSILSDSRCPYGAECVWAGNAEVRMKIKVNNDSVYLFNLNTLQSFRQDTIIKGISCKLIELTPHPDIHIKYSYLDYKVKLYYSIVDYSSIRRR